MTPMVRPQGDRGICDVRPAPDGIPNVDFAFDADGPRFVEMLVEIVGQLDPRRRSGLLDVLERRDSRSGKRHAGRVVRAVAVRVLGEVLLVVVLGEVERRAPRGSRS